MKKEKKMKVKKGAASFYIVAISTLILVIIAMSFAAIIVSEMTRTSNDDLAQSAYDSALAGVEDAKLAFYNYQKCLAEGATAVQPSGSGVPTCGNIVYYVENYDECDGVAKILGRGEGEVIIKESSQGENNLQQAYTCVKIKKELDSYISTIVGNNQTKIVKANFDDETAQRVQSIVIRWARSSDVGNSNYNDLSKEGIFNKNSLPPVLALSLIQTAKEFNMKDFEETIGDETNRGTIYLVPSGNENKSKQNVDNKYYGAYDVTKGGNYISEDGFLRSNDKKKVSEDGNRSLPYIVFCDENKEFLCSATISLPEPVDGNRNGETFMLAVSFPYGNTKGTDFKITFYDKDIDEMKAVSIDSDDAPQPITIENSQIVIDSTGRANDLFRRVEVRLEPESSGSSYPLYAIQLLGKSNKSLIDGKNQAVTSEWNFK